MADLNAQQRAAVEDMIANANAITRNQFDQLMQGLRNGRQKEKVRLGEFSSATPSDWRHFKPRLEEAKRLNGWSDQEGKQHLKIALTGDAAANTQDIQLGSDPAVAVPADDAKTFDEYVSDIGLRFVSHASSKLAISEFMKRSQKPTENLLDFHSGLRELFTIARPNRDPTDDQDLIRHFSEGILDENVAQYVLEQDPQTYQEALTLGQHKEGVTAQRKIALGRLRGSRINAIEFGQADECPPPGASRGVSAINYPYGSSTPSSTEANRILRNGGPFSQQGNFSQPQGNNSFIGAGGSGGGYYDRFQSHHLPPKRRGKGGGTKRGQPPAQRGGKRNGKGRKTFRRPFRRPGKNRVNAVQEEGEVSELRDLMNGLELESDPSSQGQGNWAWPRD